MIAAVITNEGSILYANLGAVGETPIELMEPVGTELGSAYMPLASEPTPVVGIPVVGVNDTKTSFIERLGDSYDALLEPFGAMQSVNAGDVKVTQWFNNAHLARFEMPWQDLGMLDVEKNFHEVRLSLERACRGYVGIYCETDDGKRSRQGWRGLIHPREKIIAPINISGRKIRIRVVAILFNDARFLVRDASIGYTI